MIFRQLADQQLRQITNMLLDDSRRRLRAQDVSVDVTLAAVEWLAQRGYQPEYGARPLRRTIQREVDNRLSRMLLDGSLQPHSRLRIDVADGELTIHKEEESEHHAS